MKEFINLLRQEFQSSANTSIASQQKAYMQDQFEFFGLKTPVRRELQKSFLVKDYLPNKNELVQLVKTLWKQPERDFQLFGQELVFKYVHQFEKKDIHLLEFMISNKSWWDTVDFIANKLVGAYFKKFPEEIESKISKWIASENIWLHRTALLFQLKYKEDLDTDLLSRIINSLEGSNEFFVNKAIGWVLREYSRINPKWVVDFVSKTNLDTLSRREALRLLK